MYLFQISTTLTIICLVTCVAFGWLKFTSKNEKFLHYLSFLLLFEIITNFLKLNNIDNIALYPVYVIGDFILIMLFLTKTYTIENRFLIKNKYWIFLLSIIFTIEPLFLIFTKQNPILSYSKLISNTLILIYIASILLQFLTKINLKFIDFVLPITLFIYYSISTILFLSLNFLVQSNNIGLFYKIWTINNFLSTSLYISSIIYFYYSKKEELKKSLVE